MIFLRVILLWGLVSVHIVGAAFLFRRLFPRESVWLGFIIPEILVVLLCNFIEHHIALTVLGNLLPLTTMASVASIAGPKSPWRVMRLPTLLFLGAFTFTLFLRILIPDIESSRDGIPDLGLISSFMFGQTLPADSTWLPPVKLLHYYCLEHYGASVLIRLLGVDLGSGFNLCCALLSAYIYFLAGAVAWHLSRGKLWIVILVPILTACAATGDAGYLWLQVHKLVPENIIDPHSLLDNPDQPNNWLVRHLKPIYHAARPELMPPGFGGWVGSFHSAQTGQLIICFSLLSLIEVLRRKRTNWPWICLGISPFLMLTTCTWGVPMAGFIVLSGLIACFWMKIVPENSRLVLAVFAGLVALVEPMLSYFLQWSLPATVSLAESDMHTELPEFLAQWWPVFIPWIALCLTWKRLSPTTHIVLIMTPLAFAWVEIWNFGWRGDMTAKSWGIIYASAWIVFLPEIARQRRWPFRVILILIASTCALSLCFWVTYYSRVIVPEEIGHLDGQGQFRLDPRKAKILETLSRLKDRIIVTGRVEERDTQNTLLAQLSCNRAYVAWSMILDTTFYSNGLGEATRRNVEVNALYDGKESNPLEFLRQRDIAALVIYPNDNIDPAIVDQFKQKLAPYYTYEDGYSPTSEQPQQALSPERPCAGVFLYHPEMAALAGAAQGP